VVSAVNRLVEIIKYTLILYGASARIAVYWSIEELGILSRKEGSFSLFDIWTRYGKHCLKPIPTVASRNGISGLLFNSVLDTISLLIEEDNNGESMELIFAIVASGSKIADDASSPTQNRRPLSSRVDRVSTTK